MPSTIKCFSNRKSRPLVGRSHEKNVRLNLPVKKGVLCWTGFATPSETFFTLDPQVFLAGFGNQSGFSREFQKDPDLFSIRSRIEYLSWLDHLSISLLIIKKQITN